MAADSPQPVSEKAATAPAKLEAEDSAAPKPGPVAAEQTYFYGMRAEASRSCDVSGWVYWEVPMQVAPANNDNVYGYATFTKPPGSSVYARMLNVSDTGMTWGASAAVTGTAYQSQGYLVRVSLGSFGPIVYRSSVLGQFYTYLPGGSTPARVLSFTVANQQ